MFRPQMPNTITADLHKCIWENNQHKSSAGNFSQSVRGAGRRSHATEVTVFGQIIPACDWDRGEDGPKEAARERRPSRKVSRTRMERHLDVWMHCRRE